MQEQWKRKKPRCGGGFRAGRKGQAPVLPEEGIALAAAGGVEARKPSPPGRLDPQAGAAQCAVPCLAFRMAKGRAVGQSCHSFS